jgi:hypothetical protein
MLTIPKPQNSTLIDSLSEGYAAINRRPWLLLVPILLNIYLWFGAQVSLGPLIGDVVGALRRAQPELSSQGDLQALYDQILSRGGTDVRAQLALLNIAVPILQPRVVGPAEAGGLAIPTAPQVLQPIDAARPGTIEISTFGGAVLVFVAINALGLALSAIFLEQVGAAVRREWPPMGGLRGAVRVGLSVLGSIAVIAGVALALGLPLMFFAMLLVFLNQTLGVLAAELLFAIVFWIGIYIGFYPEAIVMSNMGPLRAIYASFNVVRRNFWGTLGFLIVWWVITLGSGVIWARLVGSTVGLIVAIVGSSYIGSGLLAARMAFYRDRLRRWQAATNQAPGLRARN